MIPSYLETLFWDINVDTFQPEAYPEYTISRVLEYGDEAAVAWLHEIFPQHEIRRVLCTEQRLSRKSANFWAIILGVPSHEVAALKPSQ